MRINRYIARSGVTSRRKAEELIKSGKISVNGKLVTDLTLDIDEAKDTVTVDDVNIKLPSTYYYALNKPVGYTTTKEDKHAEKTVFELLPKEDSLFTVGRLDKDTSGLLLVTNDGEFAQNIIHPSMKIEKEYEVKTQKPLTINQIDKLKQTIELTDGPAKFKSFKYVPKDTATVIIEEGRNRIVRRMISKVGNKVKELKRIRVGLINLDVDIGSYRELTKKEIKEYV